MDMTCKVKCLARSDCAWPTSDECLAVTDQEVLTTVSQTDTMFTSLARENTGFICQSRMNYMLSSTFKRTTHKAYTE